MKRDLAREGDEIIGGGEVAALRSLDARGSRFELRISGAAIVVSAELIADFRLAVGATLEPGEVLRLRDEAYALRVFDRAVSLLALRARSARNLLTALRQRGAESPIAARAIERLAHLGLLDDTSFARGLAAGKAGSKGMSRRRLTQVLVSKGVSPAVAGDAAREALPDTDEFDAALLVAERRVKSLRSLDEPTRRRRLHAFLARRGFAGETVRRVLQRVLKAEEP